MTIEERIRHKVKLNPIPNLTDKDKLRFILKVKLSSACWIWQGCIRPNGYGQFTIHNKHYAAHRVMYKITYGSIQTGKIVCHSCDIRHCVNPDHLWIGTHKDNMSDCSKKGRISTANNFHRYKTHCKHGHKLSGSNIRTREHKPGMFTRDCIACQKRRNKERHL